MEERKIEQPKKKRRLWIWIVAGVLALALIVAAMFVMRMREAAESMQVSGLVSAEAESRALTTTAVGTGNLDFGERLDVEMPQGLFVEELLVEAGDRVVSGEAILRLSGNSIRGRMEELLNSLSQLDGQIEMAKGDDDETLDVRAGASGRVKAIYAREGNDSFNTMQEHGALLLLSIDGKMAVDIPAGDLREDDEVDVEIDGEDYEGSVESIKDGVATICFTDNGPEIGEDARVYEERGALLGTGETYVHEEMRVISRGGTVKEIHVEENDKVSLGKSLMTLEELGESVEYRSLLEQRAEMEETLEQLRQLAEDPVLYAPASGLVETLIVQESDGVYMPGAVQAVETLRFTALTIASDATMKLTIDAHELDILSIKEGQEALVEFDAIENRAFSGQITDIASVANGTGGLVKYAVEIELEKDADMRAGMSATATVTVGSLADALCIPVAAVQESGMQVYVYTSVDEKSGELAGEVAIVTGLSDGEYVQVLEGLAAGDTVYYMDDSMNWFFPFAMQRMAGGADGGDGE